MEIQALEVCFNLLLPFHFLNGVFEKLKFFFSIFFLLINLFYILTMASPAFTPPPSSSVITQKGACLPQQT